LSTKANNHFGIKADKSWSGKTMKWEDDDYHNGKLIKSKFRKYKSADQSFIDHSEFLANKKRYKFLFDYDITDYVSWSKGLVKAGYATDPKYASKLIKIIEKYGLYEYDLKYIPVKEAYVKNRTKNKKSGSYTLSHINKAKIIIAHAGETPKSISKKLGISVKKIIKYNDNVKRKYHKFKEGDIVYLSSKRKKYYGSDSYHNSVKGETLVDISQKYGINLRYLARINKIKPHKKLKKGQRIKLKPVFSRSENIVVATSGRNDKYLFDAPLTPEK
jgi:LysM repeat protein